jgi:hypothetical protein
MLELLKKYPKAAAVVKSHFLEIMLESLNTDSLPDDFKEHVRMQGINDDMVKKVLEKAPRNMFDVFDDNDMFINITFDHEDRVFRYSVDGEVDSQNYLFRRAAEEAAITEAFSLLNQKLTEDEKGSDSRTGDIQVSTEE